jgi:predicted amidophosphoribosyltransferase
MSKQFNSKYLSDCIEHALERCQQVTPIRADVIRLIRWAFDHSHEVATHVCRDLRRQHEKQISRLRGLDPWERRLLAAAKGLLLPQAAAKMNCVLPECRLALDELETRFYTRYQSALPQRDNLDWRYNYSWICQEADWQRRQSLMIPAFVQSK